MIESEALSDSIFMFKSRRFLALFLILSLAFAACSGGDKSTRSDGGAVLESYIPGDVGLMFSFSLLDDGQYEAVQSIEKALGDEDRIIRTISETVDSIDYSEDLVPALGEQFQMIYAVRSEDDLDQAFSAIQLQDAEKMEEILDKMVDDGAMTVKKLSKLDAYVDEENQFYGAVQGSALTIANTADGLIEMRDLSMKQSLWENDVYQDLLEDVGEEYVFFGAMFPANIAGDDLDLVNNLGVAGIPAVVDQQSLVVRAEEEGFRFDIYVQANEDEAKEADVSFDRIPRSEPYLFGEVPSDHLMGYMESFGLKQTFDQANNLGDETGALEELEVFFRDFFAMDFEEEVLAFMDKGYSISLHQNGAGVVPGISFLMDVSSDRASAEEFVAQMDLQVDGLQVLLESILPGAVTKETVSIRDSEMSVLRVDLAAIEGSSEGLYGPLPAGLTENSIQLFYGLMGDRLLLSTANVWERLEWTSIEDSELYAELSTKLDDVEDGLVLVDAKGISSFIASLQSLRQELTLDVSVEADAKIEDFLDGFRGMISASDTGAYNTHFGGFLMIAND